MSEWQAKRFWEKASIERQGKGFSILLDGRPLRTPAKAHLLVPTERMANAIAAEWQAQGEKIDPTSMPVTRTANAAIDKVGAQFSEVANLISAYGETDLICYRAHDPLELVERQNEAWDPLLDWAEGNLNAPLQKAKGIMFVQQDQNALASLETQVKNFNAFELSAFYDLVALSGSLIIGFAVVKKHLNATELWARSRIDEEWQIEKWGEDEEAAEAILVKKSGFEHAATFYFMCN